MPCEFLRPDFRFLLIEQFPADVMVHHGELAVPHIFKLAETCKYLGVIGDARRDDPTWKIKDIAQGDV